MERDGGLLPCSCHEPCRCSASVQRSCRVILAPTSLAWRRTRAPCESSQAHVILDDAKPMDLRSSPRRQAVARVRGLVAPSARFFRVFSVARSCSYIAFTSKFSLECRRRRGLVSSSYQLCFIVLSVVLRSRARPV